MTLVATWEEGKGEGRELSVATRKSSKPLQRPSPGGLGSLEPSGGSRASASGGRDDTI
jgi:hypothetical protein